MPILKCYPVTGHITQLFGARPDAYARFGLRGHNGIDFGCPVGTPVLALAAGVVMEATGDPDGYGEYIKVRTEWGEYLVAHLSQYQVTQGATVAAEQRIGLSGNTGNSTGPHLHFGMRINPYDRRDGQPAGEKSWGGFSDPKPYLDAIGSTQDLLGVHFIGSSQPTLDDVHQMQPSVCLFLDPNLGDVQAFNVACPQTKIVGRIYVPDSEMADRIRTNPLQAAAWAHQLVMVNEARGIVDYWQVANEVCQVQWDEFQNLVTFERERMRLADQAGYKCGIFAFSVGNPDMPAADKMGYWRATYPALDYAEAHGHVLLIHEYGCCPNIWGPDEKGGSEWLLHRWEHQVRPYLKQRRLMVIVSEFGYDGLIQPDRRTVKSRDIKSAPKRSASGGNPGWKTAQTAEAYATDLRNVATYLERYSGQVLGYTIFQAGDGGTWANYDISGEVLARLATGQAPPPEPPIIPPGGGQVTTKVYDIYGNEQSLEWLATNWDGCEVLPAHIPANTTEYWRLSEIHCTTGNVVVAMSVRRGNLPAVQQPVVMTYPSLANPDGELPTLPSSPNNWAPRGNVQRTNSNGLYEYELGPTFGPFYHAWVLSSAPSDCLSKTGMMGGTDHQGPLYGIWELSPTAPVYDTLRDALLGEAAAHWAIELNKDASLQRAITQTGDTAFVPTTAEFDVKFGGIEYVAQAGEHMVTGEVRVWYCPRTNYGDIRFEVR